MERKVNAYPSHIWIKSNQLPSHKKPGRDCLGKQNLQGWPGWAKETKEICKGLNIMDVNTTYLTKNEYKALVDGAIKRKSSRG